MSFENAAIYILVLGGLSFCVGIYSLEIYYKMTKALLPGYYIQSKYYILQMYFVITRFHVIIFDYLGTNEYLSCWPPISSFVYGLCQLSYISLLKLITIFILTFHLNHLILIESSKSFNIELNIELNRFDFTWFLWPESFFHTFDSFLSVCEESFETFSLFQCKINSLFFFIETDVKRV